MTLVSGGGSEGSGIGNEEKQLEQTYFGVGLPFAKRFTLRLTKLSAINKPFIGRAVMKQGE